VDAPSQGAAADVEQAMLRTETACDEKVELPLADLLPNETDRATMREGRLERLARPLIGSGAFSLNVYQLGDSICRCPVLVVSPPR
jgi:hypothetical protein